MEDCFRNLAVLPSLRNFPYCISSISVIPSLNRKKKKMFSQFLVQGIINSYL